MTRRERRAVRWGALVILVTLALRVVPGAAHWLSGQQAETASRSTIVARMRADLTGMDALADSVARARAELVGLDSLLLEAHSDIGAFAEMSLRMRGLADRYALTIQQTTQERDTIVALPFRRARIRVAFQADSRGLLGALQALAAELPVLTVNSLSVKTQDPASNPEVLDVEVAVTGWYIDRKDGS